MNEQRKSNTVVELTHKGISLDVLSHFRLFGGLDSTARVHAALITFSAAIRQERDSVARLLYVIAAEILSRPFNDWKRNKATERFISFYEKLMPDILDKFSVDEKFVMAFEIDAKDSFEREKILRKIYDMRSEIAHDGIEMSYTYLEDNHINKKSFQRWYLRQFAENAIRKYIQSPRSSIVGHPKIEEQRGRRKNIAGVVVLEHAEKDEAFASALFELLCQYVDRPEDRALFGLPPKDGASEQGNTPRSG